MAVRGFISFILPVKSFIRQKEIKPMAIPLAMLKVRGMPIMTRKAGMDSVGSSHLILRRVDIMKLPTTMRAGAAA